MANEGNPANRSLSGAQILAKLLALGALGAAFTDSAFAIVGSGDATKIARFEVDGITTGTTRVYTLPDASIVVSGSASALTSGRVPFVTTGGLLTDSAALTWSGTSLATTATGAASFSTAGGYTSTVATGTAPFTATSTTVCPNLNASLLLGGTWAIPGSIGATTPAAGAFTTLSASSTCTLAGFTSSAAGAFSVAGSTILTLTNTNASASNAGGGISARSDDGAAMASGDRLGHFTFAGAKDASHTIANPCRFEAITTEAWGSSATGTKLALYTCPNGTTGALIALTLEQDQSATFAGPVTLPSYAVASLPTGSTGMLAYASNGRKNGEGAGVGTGVLVFKDGTAWRACDTGATVAA
jgi:hypothetical protein